MTFETVIKAETQEQADSEFLRRDKQADVVHDSGINVQVIELRQDLILLWGVRHEILF
jgi:hypothetical protein